MPPHARGLGAMAPTPGGHRGFGSSFLWFVLCLATRSGASCWIDGYSSDVCCDAKYGPTGNTACWDDVFQYDPCCTGRNGVAEQASPADGVATDAGASLDGDLLEHALRPKLLQILAEAEADGDENFPVEFEANLRQAIETAENRTISRRQAIAYLGVFLRLNGRHEEASRVLAAHTTTESFKIASSGSWVGADAEGYHMHDAALADALVAFFLAEGARTVGDFGCGLGLYVRDFRAAGLRSGGFDGNPSTASLSQGRCQVADLSSALDFGTSWDWVLSLEVAEHIPRQFEDVFLGNLERHARRGIVLSWGNQAGEGHVNVRPRQEVEQVLTRMGFQSSEASAVALRSAATLPWFDETIVVFRRANLSQPCRAEHARGVRC